MRKLLFCVLAVAGMLTAACSADDVQENIGSQDVQLDGGQNGGNGGITPPPPPPKPRIAD